MKFVFVPPQDSSILSDVPINEWMTRLQDSVPEVKFFAPVTEKDTLYHIKDADAAFGTLTTEMLQVAKKLRWVQAPAAAPPARFAVSRPGRGEPVRRATRTPPARSSRMGR